MSENIEFEFESLPEQLNEKEVIKSNIEMEKEREMEKEKELEDKEFKETKEDLQKDKINLKKEGWVNDSFSISGYLGIIFDSLILKQIGASDLTIKEIDGINKSGMLIDEKYHLKDKVGVEFAFAGSMLYPFMQLDRYDKIMFALKNRGVKHEDINKQ